MTQHRAGTNPRAGRRTGLLAVAPLLLVLVVPDPLGCGNAYASDSESLAAFAPDRVLIRLRAPASRSATLPAFGHADSPVSTGLPALDGAIKQVGGESIELLFPPVPERFPDRTSPAYARSLASEIGIDRWCVLHLAPGSDVEAAVQALSEAPDIEVAEPDYKGRGASVPPDDPFFANQWYLSNPSLPGADIHAVDAWKRSTGSSNVIVAILDSGIDWNHPDLDDRIWSNPNEIADNSLDDDQNGYIDDVRGWDFVTNDNDPMDDHGHGTNVAGIVGAEGNNGIGVAGVDWNCRLMACKNLDATNSGLYSWWTSSIVYAANQGAKVLNMSEGGTGYSTSMRNAVDYAHGLGAIVCAAMMNANTATVYYPAGFVNVVAVGATNQSDARAAPFCWGGGSCFGTHIELVAPGDWIYSTLWDDTYGTYCGTSQATPQVSGACALAWSLVPTLAKADLITNLLATCDDQVGLPLEDSLGFDVFHGNGRLNLDRFLASVSAVGVGPEPGPAGGPAIALVPRAFPNPMSGAGTLSFIAPDRGRVTVELVNAAGRRVEAPRDLEVAGGAQAVPLDASALSAGVYYARISFVPHDGSQPQSASLRLAVLR